MSLCGPLSTNIACEPQSIVPRLSIGRRLTTYPRHSGPRLRAPTYRLVKMLREAPCPFRAADQLVEDDGGNNNLKPGQSGCRSLPGHPLVALDQGEQLGTFLEGELCCDDLETMAPHLWTMSTQSSASVQPLHRHRLLGREILITESPRLHLVWYYNRVFIKPMPRYLLSHKFWTTYLLCGSDAADELEGSPLAPSPRSTLVGRTEKIRRAALGFVRTYRHLIRHESDFNIAQSVGLLPSEATWPRFCAFVSRFEDSIQDADVSNRYHYGDLRLTRLNFYCMLFLRRTHFEHLPTQYADYFARYFGPLLFVFAAQSLVLSAMQLEIAVQDATDTPLFATYWAVCRWFGAVVVVATITVSVYLFAYMVFMIAREWAVALTVRRRRLRQDRSTAVQE